MMSPVVTKLSTVQDRTVQERNAQDSAATSPFPWPAGSATGIGSMPGDDPAQACAVVFGELPDLPHLPELPGRGAGADMIGRTAALLVGLSAETTPQGWKLAARPGRDLRRAAGFRSTDLDAAEEAGQGYQGAFKVQVCGPWTLAASLELSRSMEPALTDPGAVADLTASLAEGAAAHVAEVRRRLPAATVVLQLDEPALPRVLAGGVPSASGLTAVGPVDAAIAAGRLRDVLAAAGSFTVLHSCAPEFPFRLVMEAGAGAASFDLQQLRRSEIDTVAEAADGGMGLLAGALPTADAKRMPSPESPAPRQTASAVVTLWHRTGLPRGGLARQVVITPACGLAGLSPAAAHAALAHCREAARIAPEMIEEGAR